ncbi:MAG: DNA primase [Thermodesulfobacteriota bacterium]
MVIPKEKVAQIRQSVDIVDLISESVLLRKTGKSFIGLCPFHAEKTPSFTVSPDKQIYHCFGCGEGGDAISFVMKHEGVSFTDAVRMLARKCGIDVEPKPGRNRTDLREAILEANRVAAEYYAETLRNEESASAVRRYIENRGISWKTVEAFHLGYAPDRWDALVNQLRRRTIDVGVAEKAGLIVRRDQKPGHYDRFRNRLMFPIRDAHRQVVALGGRVLDDSRPKYLNSPESLVYQKSRHLYGIDRARLACRRTGEVFVTEGYLDLIAMHMNGFEHTVATLGTAMTVEHIRMLKGMAERIVLMFDSDEAGLKAALRCIELFKTEKRLDDIRILVLPEGHDPDSFLRKFGADAMAERMKASLSVFSFLIETAVRQHGLGSSGKVRVVESLIEPIAAIEAFDSLSRFAAIRELSERTGISETAIQERIRQASVQTGPRRPQAPAAAPPDINRLERSLAMMLLHFPKTIPTFRNSPWWGKLEDSMLNHLVLRTCERYGNGTTPKPIGEVVAALIEEADTPEEKRLITELSMSTDTWNEAACRRLLAQYTLRRRHDMHAAWKQKIRFAEQTQDTEALQKLMEDAQSAFKATGGMDP